MGSDNFRLVLPTNLISPTKRPERDYIKKSPLKFPNSPIKKFLEYSKVWSNSLLFRLVLTDPAPRMEGWRLTARKMVFRHILVERVRQKHQEFLEEKQSWIFFSFSLKSRFSVSFDSKELLHPEFELDGMPDIAEAQLPQMPKMEKPLRTMRDYLEIKTPPKEKKVEEKVEKIPLLERVGFVIIQLNFVFCLYNILNLLA